MFLAGELWVQSAPIFVWGAQCVFVEIVKLSKWNAGGEFLLSPRKGIHCGIGQHLFLKQSDQCVCTQTAWKWKLYSEIGEREQGKVTEKHGGS